MSIDQTDGEHLSPVEKAMAQIQEATDQVDTDLDPNLVLERASTLQSEILQEIKQRGVQTVEADFPVTVDLDVKRFITDYQVGIDTATACGALDLDNAIRNYLKDHKLVRKTKDSWIFDPKSQTELQTGKLNYGGGLKKGDQPLTQEEFEKREKVSIPMTIKCGIPEDIESLEQVFYSEDWNQEGDEIAQFSRDTQMMPEIVRQLAESHPDLIEDARTYRKNLIKLCAMAESPTNDGLYIKGGELYNQDEAVRLWEENRALHEKYGVKVDNNHMRMVQIDKRFFAPSIDRPPLYVDILRGLEKRGFQRELLSKKETEE